jgi:predicted small secreted protein
LPGNAPNPSDFNAKTTVSIFLMLGVAAFAVASAGCNTTKGLGKDIEKLGDKIQEKASRWAQAAGLGHHAAQ